MKKEDFERLKAVCEKEGFELQDYREGNLVYVKKKDIWDGVEFAECVLNSESYTVGKIYKINPSFLPSIMTYQDDFGRENGNGKIYFNPSTESAYIDQLKKEAFERFGEIKEGDRFDRTWACKYWPNPAIIDGTKRGFSYQKDYDQLSFNGSVIYESGKWATKLKLRIEVLPTRESLVGAIDTAFEKDRDGFSKFLANQLEAYLNR